MRRAVLLAGAVALAAAGLVLSSGAGPKSEPKTAAPQPATPPSAPDVTAVIPGAPVAAGVDPMGKVCYHGGLHRVVESQLKDDRRDNACNTLAWGVAHSNNAIVGKLAYQHLEPNALEQMARDLGMGSPLPMCD